MVLSDIEIRTLRCNCCEVTAACCLFLAGKVEETPKKCKDIIKTFRMMLNDAEFAAFGEDPKEEVMTLERILLQTIKFDLMVEHPYAFLLKYAKLVKGDKAKIQKLVQMAWTFINDSLCTTLCLQWEPEIVAVAVMYLTSRLTKFEIVDWQGKPPSYRGKWYEFLVDDVTLELLEDICHQVLDLYSNTPGSQPKDITGSPAPAKSRHLVQSSDDDQSRTPKTPKSPHAVKRPAPSSAAGSSSSQAVDSDVNPPAVKQREQFHGESATSAPHSQYASGAHSSHQSAVVTSHATAAAASQAAAAAPGAGTSAIPTSSSFSSANPYMSTQMYSSSFMSTEGSQSIQSLMGVQGPASAAGQVQGHGYQGTPSASGAASRSDYSGAAPSGGYPAAAAGYQQTVSMSAPVAPPFAGYQQNAAGAGASVPPPYGHGYKQSQYPSATEQSTLPDYSTYGAGGQSSSSYAAENQQVAGQRYQSAGQPVYHSQSTGSYPNQQSAGVSGYQSYQAPVASDQTYHGQSTAAAGGFQSHELARERFPGRDRPQNASGFHGQHSSANYHHGNVQGFSGRSGAGTGYNQQQQQQQQPDYHQQTHSGQAPPGGAASHGQNWGY